MKRLTAMATWTEGELARIGEADELHIQSRRPDGSLRKPVTIWVVRVNDGLYVRCVGGRGGKWFRGTQDRQEGHIQSGGAAKDVSFEDGDDGRSDAIDDAYRTKYRGYSAQFVDPTVTPDARAATIRLVPRS